MEEEVKNMVKKLLGFVLSFLFLAMLVMPIFAVSAKKPVTLTLTGTMISTGFGDSYTVEAGISGNTLWKIRNMPVLWTGDISGSGFFHENMLVKEGPVCDVGAGTHFLEDVTTPVGTGDLIIGCNKDTLQYFIKSGSDDLRSIRGKGTITPISMFEYEYEFEIQINP
jgi:hypothetical protein